ncbi:MAG: hypothetical protein LUQ11_08540 [Methylococcaceae bacterium]|nr:hypothetical protein [Methylococcaceae bacterium]
MKYGTGHCGRWLIAALFMLQSDWTFAHPPGLSSLDVAINPTQIDVKATFALQDIEAFAPIDRV